MNSTASEPITLQDQTRLQRNLDIVASQFDGETVMMDADFESYFGMAQVGTHIWAELEVEMNFGELIQRLLQAAGSSVTEAKCREETKLFLNDLYANRLLRVDGQLKPSAA